MLTGRVYVTDNASNCRSAFEKYDWLGCLGHIIHLVVRVGFEVPEIKKLIARTKDTLKYFHQERK